MLTDACWSPTRPSLFFTCRTDGWIEAWDIIENQKTPVMTHKTQDGPAHCLAAHSEGFLMCVGGDNTCSKKVPNRSSMNVGDKGDVSLIQMSSSLGEVTKVEKVTVSTMLERETRREKILSALNKEARLKSKAKSKMKMMMDSGMLKRVG